MDMDITEQGPKTLREARLSKLQAIPGDKILTVGIGRYLTIATVSAILGRAKSTVSKWCKNKTVFRWVLQSPEEYNGCYLIPFEEVERVVIEDALPQPGNPIWIAAGKINPTPYPYKKKKGERKKRVANGTKNKNKAKEKLATATV